jgi:F-box associated protein
MRELAIFRSNRPQYQRLLFVEQEQTLDKFPDELLLRIFRFLEVKGLGRVSQVNRKWHNLANDEEM